ncbi:apyrase-like [Phymastichus coffea]|uniref:apyrase-like n=1 Tax=Phymastichus coffea TaxID=108790 RepID=UPI00273AA0B1|nr:apyrase-like [Phymastichus coffea]
MAFNVKFILAIVLYFSVLIFCSAGPINKKGEYFLLSIIHFSDFHARFIEVSPSGGLCYEQEKDRCVGGVSRVATIVERLKKIRRNPIFLNAGDCFQGTLYYELFKGNITAYFMNKLHPDVHTIGNHDLDENVSGLASYIKQLDSPVVVTNIDDSEEPSIQNLYTNSTIIQKGGKDIGVIGAIYSDTDKISKTTGKLKFLNEVQTINLESKKLKARGIDIIIVLSHCGIEHDKIIASNCPDVDIVVGGHSHILLYNGKPPSNEAAYGEYPMVVTQKGNNRKVLIVHASAYTKYIGDLQIVFNEDGELFRWKGNPIYLERFIKKDLSFEKMLRPWKVEVDRIGKRLIAKTLVFLNGTCYSAECNLANLVTDAMVDIYANESSISFMTANSIQNSIPVGPVVYEDIYMTLPYNNTWDLIELKGSDLLQVLEENVAKSSSKISFVNFQLIQWSGMKVVYNLKKEQSKIVSVKVRCLHCNDPKFEDLNSDQWYRIVVPSYVISQSFETIFTKHRLIHTGKSRDIDNLIDYVEKKKVINITTESRMVFV